MSAARVAVVDSRYESLDFWRGIACLSVTIYHATSYYCASNLSVKLESHSVDIGNRLVLYIGELWLGVVVFFVISGYCIATVADKQRQRTHGIGSYFRRRFKRIYPPFWACLLIWCGLIVIAERFVPGCICGNVLHLTAPQDLTWQQWLGNLTLTEIWRPALFGPPPPASLLGTMWTLCYEEQFYCVVGVMMLVFPRYFFESMLMITAYVYVNTWSIHPQIFSMYRITRTIEAYQTHVGGVFWDGSWLYFAVGVGVYYWVHHAGRFCRIAIPFAMALAIFAELLPFEKLGSFNASQKSRLAALGFGFVLMRLHRFDAKVSRAAIVQPVSRCGLMCYSLYLVHWPVVLPISKYLYYLGIRSAWETLLITVPLCLGASLVIAKAFFNCIERRFLNQPLSASGRTAAAAESDESIRQRSITDADPGMPNHMQHERRGAG